jgi:hypothetical protein
MDEWLNADHWKCAFLYRNYLKGIKWKHIGLSEPYNEKWLISKKNALI